MHLWMLVDEATDEDYTVISEKLRNDHVRGGLVTGIERLSHLAMLEFERV